jgi:hypothetical protein
MSYRISVNITCHKGMVGYLGTISFVPQHNSNSVPENVTFSNTSYFATKLPKRLLKKRELLNCSLK